ncbi:unnamed protein product [Lactuca saligna]|uniref:Generative cell specific-1/HAP2 domain-containing protein n=1 Tax=Lactuca saligna TaxID=75948 RepID=A0AA36E0E3_LACSI|nr:unnamed protein product [Lactuca saligna]
MARMERCLLKGRSSTDGRGAVIFTVRRTNGHTCDKKVLVLTGSSQVPAEEKSVRRRYRRGAPPPVELEAVVGDAVVESSVIGEMGELCKPWKIERTTIPNLQALTHFGTTTITARNIHEVEASYSLTFDCSICIIRMEEQFFILKPKQFFILILYR